MDIQTWPTDRHRRYNLIIRRQLQRLYQQLAHPVIRRIPRRDHTHRHSRSRLATAQHQMDPNSLNQKMERRDENPDLQTSLPPAPAPTHPCFPPNRAVLEHHDGPLQSPLRHHLLHPNHPPSAPRHETPAGFPAREDPQGDDAQRLRDPGLCPRRHHRTPLHHPRPRRRDGVSRPDGSLGREG